VQSQAQDKLPEGTKVVWNILSSHEPLTRARIPDGLRVYAVGDVHGRADLLDNVLSRVDADLAKRPIHHSVRVFLGDYIDRGPESPEVVDRLVRCGRRNSVIFLKGNHESYLARFLADSKILDMWRREGGLNTLVSYGLRPSVSSGSQEKAQLSTALNQILPLSHRLFFGQLKTMFACGDFLFVHAGIRPGIPLENQKEQDLLEIREDFLQYKKPLSKFIIHGHSPVMEPDVRTNRINIDTGAYATNRLTCIMLENDEFAFI
jgi:serine/threonine protein phosphatase 1